MNTGPMKENAERAISTLHRVLGEIGWASESDQPATSFRVDLGPPHVPVSDVVAAIDPNAECFIFLANFAPAVPVARREAVALFLTAVNWDLLIGNFEMDYDEGAVRLRVAIDFIGAELSDESIRRAILTGMELVEIYEGPMRKVVEAEMNALGAMSGFRREDRRPALSLVSGPVTPFGNHSRG